MSFVTDKQTLADLNLLGKYKEGSMFNLFNRVKTRGGELLMEEMFRSPLTNAAAINDRVARIKYLQQIGVQLDINSELTETATQYLSENRPSNYFFSIFQVCKEKMQEMMYSSEKYYLHQKNIQAIVEVLQAAGSLSEQLENKKLSHNPCSDMQERLEKIVSAESLRGLESKHPYTLKEMVQYHYLFLNKHRHELEELLQLIHQFDVFVSVAYIAEQKKLNYAQASDKQNGELLKVENLRHPSLLNAKGNSITLATEENVLFLTGANMAGKSTWMKTLGISFYLAHMGFPVAADKMRFSVMEGIFTSINVPDDISQGWSHFYAEVMRVKLVAKEVS
ncbi:MAG: DNA mismatch repair protein, partial [Chitinophagaceae bacterium]|nr:DNA mismatch repair protein [Chitinophagaceae bacterium]